MKSLWFAGLRDNNGSDFPLRDLSQSHEAQTCFIGAVFNLQINLKSWYPTYHLRRHTTNLLLQQLDCWTTHWLQLALRIVGFMELSHLYFLLLVSMFCSYPHMWFSIHEIRQFLHCEVSLDLILFQDENFLVFLNVTKQPTPLLKLKCVYILLIFDRSR